MGTALFRRPARKSGPREPRGEIVLESPPELPETVTGGGGAMAMLQYLPMLAGAGATGLLVTGSGGKPITYLASGMMALSMVGMAVSGMGRSSGEKKRRLDGDRRDYQRYLEQVRRRIRKAAEQQRASAQWHHPDPDALFCIGLGSRLWERRPGDEDFLACRVGRGSRRLAVTLVPPETKPVEDLEPVSAAALRRFVRTHRSVTDLPAALALPAFGRLFVSGDPERSRALVRAMLCQLAAFQSPDDVVIAVCTSGPAAAQYEWLKWLPHALSENTYDAVGQARLISDDLITLEGMFGDTLTARPRWGAGTTTEGPHVVVVVDGGQISPEAQLVDALVAGATVIDLTGATGAPSGAGIARLHLEAGHDTLDLVRRGVGNRDESTPLGQADQLSVAQAESFARTISHLRVSTASGEPTDALSMDLSLPDLLRLGDPRQVDPAVTWRPRAPRDRLRVPIGLGADGQSVELDIKESAQGGMGPHGLVIGATGSGKSELLRTLVLGLALTHSSETLNFVLVDFKGGATFASLDVLPHTSAIITNLEDELILVDRMKDAIQGEMVRRQEELRAAGNYSSLRDYERAREQGADLEPMASLFIVVDEFSELLSAKPDFIELFVMIGRLGRSLGVHLLLASQRLEEGKLRGLDTHLSYRVGLRTFSSMESRVVLGVPDAYELPSAPGNGYLKEGTEGLVRFKAAYVSGGFTVSANAGDDDAESGRTQILPYNVGFIAPRDELTESRPDEQVEESGPDEILMDVLVDRLRGAGKPARKVWLPPLDEPPTLDQLLPPLKETELGLRPIDWDPAPQLAAPIGIIDRPFDQRRDPHWVHLASSHFVVVGRPQSGKSTVLRTLIAGLALTHTPEQVQIYCLDFGGGTLTGLSDLPHVGSVATRLEQERLRRTVSEINAMIAAREELFTRHRIDSMNSYRRLSANGTVPKDGFGDVFLVVDGWGTIRADHEALETAITQIASRGLGYGVHVVLTVQRWMEMRPALRDLISNRLELRLGDPTESEFDRRVATDVPEGAPGRGLSAHKLHFLSALPRIDSTESVDDLVDGVTDLVNRAKDAWQGPKARPVRLLPKQLRYDELPALEDTGAHLPIGVDEETLAPVSIDLDSEPHFMIIGDVESGKSNLLRLVAKQITSRWSPQEAKVITFDYRRGLLGAITTPHQIGYVMNSTAAPETVANIAAALRDRLAGIQVDPSAGSVPTWSGPKLILLLDDYDMIASSSQGNPMHPLVEFLPQARDIGLHVILSRSAGGAGQGMFEPVMRNLRDTGTPGLLLSGSKDEGAVLASVKMESLPPGRGRLVHRRLGSVLIQTAIV